MSNSAEGKANEVLGMDPEIVALLKEEYFLLHKTVEDFDQRALTIIKAWSVTRQVSGWHSSFIP